MTNDPTHQEATAETGIPGDVYRATVTDLIARREAGTFAFFADSIEDAREKAWRIAGQRYTSDIHVRVERGNA
jgi:hypothetical protein